jgi:hypothetical protein
MSGSVVWKHDLRDEVNHVDLPLGAVVLHVAEQHGVLRLWEVHGVGVTGTEHRVFRVAGTGHPFPVVGANARQHVGSLLVAGGDYVFHVFEETP